MKKEPFEDDGRTIANMDIEGMPWSRPLLFNRRKFARSTKRTKSDLSSLELTKGERKAMISAAFSVLAPILLLYGGLFFLAYFLLYLFWFGA